MVWDGSEGLPRAGRETAPHLLVSVLLLSPSSPWAEWHEVAAEVTLGRGAETPAACACTQKAASVTEGGPRLRSPVTPSELCTLNKIKSARLKQDYLLVKNMFT